MTPGWNKCACGNRKRGSAKQCQTCRIRGERVIRRRIEDTILRLKSRGLNQTQIASTLFLAGPQGVSFHWRRIMERFGTESEFKIALLAREAGIV